MSNFRHLLNLIDNITSKKTNIQQITEHNHLKNLLERSQTITPELEKEINSYVKNILTGMQDNLETMHFLQKSYGYNIPQEETEKIYKITSILDQMKKGQKAGLRLPRAVGLDQFMKKK